MILNLNFLPSNKLQQKSTLCIRFTTMRAAKFRLLIHRRLSEPSTNASLMWSFVPMTYSQLVSLQAQRPRHRHRQQLLRTQHPRHRHRHRGRQQLLRTQHLRYRHRQQQLRTQHPRHRHRHRQQLLRTQHPRHRSPQGIASRRQMLALLGRRQ